MKGRWTIRPIGVVRSEVKTTEEAPKQGALEGTEAEIVVDPACAPAQSDLPAHGGATEDPRECASHPRHVRDRRHAGRRHQAAFSGTGRVAGLSFSGAGAGRDGSCRPDRR